MTKLRWYEKLAVFFISLVIGFIAMSLIIRFFIWVFNR